MAWPRLLVLNHASATIFSHHQNHLAGGWELMDNCQFQLEPRRHRDRCRKHRRFRRRQRLPDVEWDHQLLEVWREIDSWHQF